MSTLKKRNRGYWLLGLILIVALLALPFTVFAQDEASVSTETVSSVEAVQESPAQSNSLLTDLLAAVLPVVAVYGLKVGLEALQTWRLNQPDQLDELQRFVHIAVQAAEQKGMAGTVQDKKKYVLVSAQRWLDSHGWKIDAAVIEAAIEAAVFREFNADRQPEPRPAGFVPQSESVPQIEAASPVEVPTKLVKEVNPS